MSFVRLSLILALVCEQPLIPSREPLTKRSFSLKTKAMRTSDKIQEPCTPFLMTPPEGLKILRQIVRAESCDFEWRSKADIWTLGCSVRPLLLYQPGYVLFTHRSLKCSSTQSCFALVLNTNFFSVWYFGVGPYP